MKTKTVRGGMFVMTDVQTVHGVTVQVSKAVAPDPRSGKMTVMRTFTSQHMEAEKRAKEYLRSLGKQ